MKKRIAAILCVAIVSCAVMALVDGVLKPGYAIKSAIKLVMFLGLPLLLSLRHREMSLKPLLRFQKKGFLTALGLGLGLFALILSAYWGFSRFADFSAIAGALTQNAGVNRDNYLLVTTYVAFANSFLEELFFRGFLFMNLKKLTNRRFAYCFSAAAFSLYHTAMMIGWFDWWLFALVLAALFVGGLIFNRLNEKQETVYTSWLTHMFANFAINIIGFTLMR